MFASLGGVSFEVIASPDRIATTQRFRYGKVPVIGASPVLQWVYDDLASVTLGIRLHRLWCNPDQETRALNILAETHQPVPFVFGNGTLQGLFVVVGLEVRDQWRSDQGDTVATEATLDLSEWTASTPSGVLASAIGAVAGLVGAPAGASAIYSPGPSPLGSMASFLSVATTTIARMGAP